MTTGQIIYIGYAPAGEPSSGPVVLDEAIIPGIVAEYRSMNYRIEGPYVLGSALLERLEAANYPIRSYSDDEFTQGEDYGRESGYEAAVEIVKDALA